MQRLNGFRLYELGAKLHPLITAGQREGIGRPALSGARSALRRILQDLPLVISRAKGDELDALINASLPEGWPQEPKATLGELMLNVSGIEAFGISSAALELETLLSAELAELPSFIATDKGVFSVARLAAQADAHFPDVVSGKLPDKAREDFRHAGRCIAFELPTASAFHLLRAVEATMHAYYQQLKGKKLNGVETGGRLPTWQAYIMKLKDAGAPEKILSTLDQVREHHRNPVMHPDEVLTMEQAMVLFGIAYSAMMAMLGEMK